MELLIGNTTMTQTTVSAAKTPAPTGKTDGQGAFGQLLQAAGLSQQAAGAEESAADQDGLMAALAALAGGLSPLLLAGINQPELTAEGVDQGIALTLQTEQGTVSLLLKDLPMNNSELARVLQDFGAAPELLTVLSAEPQGNPLDTLKANPQLMPQVATALTQMVQTLTAAPQLLVQETQTATLFQSLMQAVQIETVQETQTAASGEEKTDLAVPAKGSSLLGKLQATISMHTLQAALTMQEAAIAANAQAQTTEATSGNAVLAQANAEAGAGVEAGAATTAAPDAQPKQADAQPPAAVTVNQTHLQLPERQLKLEPVVTVRADQLRTELSANVVKRATLIEAPGRHEFRIILEPQGLGEVEVRIQSVNKQISVQLIADSLASKGMLDSALAGLKLQLQAQGIQYDRIEVQTASNSNTDLGSGLPEHRGSGQGAREQQHGGQGRVINADTFTLSDGEAELLDPLSNPDSIDVTA
ncbi:flagellar hook-length control protein FliK [Tumebacillus sp. BK434]|uniref:flagellar hook-length control protein FliK n=1 Tax=Tumebacillus sp. BK434 TaxID=2512169 RepID=UPI001053C999|nr:flagellar hook-length control protein FliK [Tumebacillus sp. BK434]TCP58823.1 flagellar hook-length control protein FliK [Tumebacillus sp. BK434]